METRFESYSGMHPYSTEGTVTKKEYKNKQYVLTSAQQYIIDDYDEYLGNVELSHYEELGYNIVRAFDILEVDENFDQLDFSWMDNEDIIQLEKSPLNKNIKRINVNVDNLEYASLPIGEEQLQEFSVSVQGKDSKLSSLKAIKAINKFISSYNTGITEGIEFIGFNPIMMQIITAIAKKYNVEVKFEDITKKL